MSRVVLLAVNAKYVHTALSVRVIAGGIRKYALLPHEAFIVEATIHHSHIEIADSITQYDPDVVGVSTYIWNADWLSGFLKQLRERLPAAVFVLGGPEASYNKEYWLSIGADHVLPGEGEYTFPTFLDALAAEALHPSVNSEFRMTSEVSAASELAREWPNERSHHVGVIPNSEFPDPLPIDPYSSADFEALKNRILYLETSRGCPFNCAFCLSAESGVRFFPIETAKQQLNKLSKSGVRTIKLVDRTFNCNAGRAYELFEYVICLDTDCRFHFEVAADLFDERTLELLRSAPPGRIQFEAGLQSFFEPALAASSRQTDLARAERNIRTLLIGNNIHIHVDLIAGLPYETLPDFMDSFDRAYSLNAHTLQLGFLKLLHGSGMRRRAAALGIRYSEKPPYEIQSSPWLSAEDICTIKQAENSLRHTRNKSRFLSSLEYVLTVTGLRPFSLFRMLGEAAPNQGMDLPGYAARIYEFCVELRGVEENELRDRMICDWLGMVKGKNMPDFLRNPDRKRAETAKAAERRLGHGIRRDEAAILFSGKGVFVDSESRDPVTGLYKVYS